MRQLLTSDLCVSLQELMQQNEIAYVLNASNTCPKPDFIPDSHFLRVPVNDSFCEKILPWLDRSVEFIGQQETHHSHSRELHCDRLTSVSTRTFQKKPKPPTPASWSTAWPGSPAPPPSPSPTS